MDYIQYSMIPARLTRARLENLSEEIRTHAGNQRLIGRAPAPIELELGERQIWIDWCDRKRTAERGRHRSPGVRRHEPRDRKLHASNKITQNPIRSHSRRECGIIKGVPMLDFDYRKTRRPTSISTWS
jgi:hypothetical protein